MARAIVFLDGCRTLALNFFQLFFFGFLSDFVNGLGAGAPDLPDLPFLPFLSFLSRLNDVFESLPPVLRARLGVMGSVISSIISASASEDFLATRLAPTAAPRANSAISNAVSGLSNLYQR